MSKKEKVTRSQLNEKVSFFRPLLPFLEALVLSKAVQTSVLTGKHTESLHS